MPQKRIDQIVDILKTHGYVTVKYLCQELHYSTATINRDLNELQRQKRILGDFSGVDTVISDFPFSEEVKNRFPHTEFIKAESPKTSKSLQNI